MQREADLVSAELNHVHKPLHDHIVVIGYFVSVSVAMAGWLYILGRGVILAAGWIVG